MQFDKNIGAELVFDGKFYCPERLLPKGKTLEQIKVEKKQMLGHSDIELLCEGAGRICYDSLGVGRPTNEYFVHLREVAHFSVVEHAHITIECNYMPEWIFMLFGRPGVWIERDSENTMRITYNLRTVLDFQIWNSLKRINDDKGLYYTLWKHANQLAPNIVIKDRFAIPIYGMTSSIVRPTYPMEKTVTMLMHGGRGFSHEQVRHRFNISQRSTRYVSEDESPWIEHPLISKFLEDTKNSEIPKAINATLVNSRKCYSQLVAELEKFLIESGTDKFTAKKQARGASRNYLGNGLYTEFFFTAPVAMWKHMLNMRCSNAADAEIRLCFNSVLTELKRSQYADDFSELSLMPAKDGLGQVLSGGGHK